MILEKSFFFLRIYIFYCTFVAHLLKYAKMADFAFGKDFVVIKEAPPFRKSAKKVGTFSGIPRGNGLLE